MHDGMPYGRNQGQGQGHSREVDRQSPTGLIFISSFKYMQFLSAFYFSEVSDGCKFCTIIDRNLKFSGNGNLLVCHSAHRKEHLTVHYGWSGNAMKTSKIYLFLCEPPNLAICFTLWSSF